MHPSGPHFLSTCLFVVELDARVPLLEVRISIVDALPLVRCLADHHLALQVSMYRSVPL